MTKASVLGWTVSLTLLALSAGCAGDGTDQSAAEPAGDEQPEVVAELKYLPLGVPVPEGVEIDALPKPLEATDYSAGNKARPNSMGRANLANSPKVPRDFGRRRHFSANVDQPVPPPGRGDRGFWVHEGHGIYAGNDVQDDLSIPDSSIGATVYAPTHMSAGGTCIETTTAHWRYAGSPTTTHGHGFWDWCRETPGWGVFEEFTAEWKAKYARPRDGELIYYTMVQETSSGCWTGSLYNFSSGYWESKFSSCGTTKSQFGTSGWTMWESWDLVGCPEFPAVQATSILTLTGGGWTALAPQHTTVLGPDLGTCFENGSYLFDTSSPNSEWLAETY